MPAPNVRNVIPFTHAGVMLPFVSYLERLGTPTEKYLQRAKLSPALHELPEALVALRLGYDFVNQAFRAEGIENPGLHVGGATSTSELGEFGKILLSARNVYQYLETGIRFAGAVTSGDSYRLDQEGEWIRLSHHHEAPGIPESDKQHSYFFSLLVTIKTLRDVAGERWCPPEVTLPALSRKASAELSEWLPGTRVVTGSSAASFLFPSAFLALPMPQNNNGNSSKGTTSIARPVPTGFLASIEVLIESLILGGSPTMETAAEAAGLSARTLRRRLAECGTNYFDLVTETRVTLAERWLAERDRSITEIASDLGYANRSNFTRAFRRLNGMSPQAYRDTLIHRDLR